MIGMPQIQNESNAPVELGSYGGRCVNSCMSQRKEKGLI